MQVFQRFKSADMLEIFEIKPTHRPVYTPNLPIRGHLESQVIAGFGYDKAVRLSNGLVSDVPCRCLFEPVA
jgi:hypothetical protein